MVRSTDGICDANVRPRCTSSCLTRSMIGPSWMPTDPSSPMAIAAFGSFCIVATSWVWLRLSACCHTSAKASDDDERSDGRVDEGDDPLRRRSFQRFQRPRRGWARAQRGDAVEHLGDDAGDVDVLLDDRHRLVCHVRLHSGVVRERRVRGDEGVRVGQLHLGPGCDDGDRGENGPDDDQSRRQQRPPPAALVLRRNGDRRIDAARRNRQRSSRSRSIRAGRRSRSRAERSSRAAACW